MAVGLLYDERFLEHTVPPGHPECPERLQSCVDALKARQLWHRFERVPARLLRYDEAVRLHRPEYWEALLALRGQDRHIDGDTFCSPGTAMLHCWLPAGSATWRPRFSTTNFALASP